MDFRVKAGGQIGLCCEASESEAVKIAVNNLKQDLKQAADIRAAESGEGTIFVGTLGISPWTEPFRSMGNLCDEQGNLRKEAYLLKVCDGSLRIVGTDRRGTIYGVYELCERIGVSPWYYWADVPVKKQEEICFPEGFEYSDYPSVEYRGIFINDEEELDHWAKAHMDEPTIGLHTYEKLFELILRLKGNYIWPAMHVNSFNMHVENGALAERMGVVVGTSHCDMLMRSNNREWIPWITKKGYTDAEYDYSIEGRNREILKEYWRESVEQNAGFEVSYTLGMRGIHDSGFETRNLHADTKEELREKKIALLEKIMKDQQEILRETLDYDPLKLFIPYKEVLELYDNGLKIPEDITLIWSNDNYGYVRRYPSAQEQERKGGNGIYYHNSYWAPPGRSYLFICSIPLAQTKYELEKAYENGIRKLWVMNVGALKPLEQEVEFYLRLAWEIGKEGAQTTDDVDRYLEQWIDRTFSGNHGRETARLLNDFTQIVNVRKIENLEEDVFSLTAYGDEWTGRMNALKTLYEKGNAIYETLPQEERDAFFQMVLMKIHAAYYTNAMYYFADRSTLCEAQGKMAAAWQYTKDSRFFDDLRRKMLRYYNEVMAEGKWDKMVTPEEFPPPRTAMYPACTPPLSMGRRSMIVTCFNGEEDRITFGQPGTKWLEIANAGEGRFSYEIKADPWMTLSSTAGEVETEKRILVTVEAMDSDRIGTIEIRNVTDGETRTIAVTAFSQEKRFHAAAGTEMGGCRIPVLEDGALTMAASDGKNRAAETAEKNAVRKMHRNAPAWKPVKRLGRGGGDLMESGAPGTVLSYSFLLDEDADVLLEVHRYPSLNSVGQIRVGISVDGKEPFVLASQSNDEWRGSWAENTMDHVDKLYQKLSGLKKGAHTIDFVAMDPYFAFSRFVLYTGERKENNLGIRPGDPTLLEAKDVERAGQIWYGNLEISPRPTLYADETNDRDTLLAKDRIIPIGTPVQGDERNAGFQDQGRLAEQLVDSGKSLYEEREGIIAIEAMGAWARSPYANMEGPWQYCASESHGRKGLALYIRQKGLTWSREEEAPSLNYQISCDGGSYRVWVLTKFNSRENADVALAVDQKEIPAALLYGEGNLWRYEAEQVWRWIPLTETKLTRGTHTISLKVFASRIRIDCIVLTKNGELPRAEWRFMPGEAVYSTQIR